MSILFGDLLIKFAIGGALAKRLGNLWLCPTGWISFALALLGDVGSNLPLLEFGDLY
jgi:hypothetical protein